MQLMTRRVKSKFNCLKYLVRYLLSKDSTNNYLKNIFEGTLRTLYFEISIDRCIEHVRKYKIHQIDANKCSRMKIIIGTIEVLNKNG